MQLFARFNQVGTSVLIASHDLDLIQQLGARALSLKQGRVFDDEISPRDDDAGAA
jgi:cell division transport system ATP-binding protein